MNLDLLALSAVILAGIPAGLFLLNMTVYRPIPGGSRRQASTPTGAGGTAHFQNESPSADHCGVSVLIPARNEEQNLRATLESVLATHDCDLEVIVLDDHSTDRTAEIVNEFTMRDSRVRLEFAPPLPAGWCGKQYACHILAGHARRPLLVFMDADVRLASDALARMARFMNDPARRANLGVQGFSSSGAGDSRNSSLRESLPPVALASGVPQQELKTFSERLLIPLIHFILLGFLPMHAMRRTRLPSMSAGCGQLFIVCRAAYQRCGGHAKLHDSLHDGLKLPRVFRAAGFATELFDATDLATCRMYHSNGETWRGLGKNATEGLAAPGTIGPMTVLLLGGQVLPFVLLAFARQLSSVGLMLTLLGVAFAWFPRVWASHQFRQPLAGALLHPVGILALLAIQWHALLRKVAGKPAEWKGRTYVPVNSISPAKAL